MSTVNYLAAGSCNFNNNGVSLWPLNQIAADTQYYVRDAVIDYISDMGTVSPAIEGRLRSSSPIRPRRSSRSPARARQITCTNTLVLDFSAGTDDIAGVKDVWADLDGTPVLDGQTIDLHTLALGNHTLTVNAMDKAYNQASTSVTFQVIATVQSLKASVDRLYAEGKIKNAGLRNSLIDKLNTAHAYLDKGQIKQAVSTLNAFVNQVKAQSGKGITQERAGFLSSRMPIG